MVFPPNKYCLHTYLLPNILAFPNLYPLTKLQRELSPTLWTGSYFFLQGKRSALTMPRNDLGFRKTPEAHTW